MMTIIYFVTLRDCAAPKDPSPVSVPPMTAVVVELELVQLFELGQHSLKSRRQLASLVRAVGGTRVSDISEATAALSRVFADTRIKTE